MKLCQPLLGVRFFLRHSVDQNCRSCNNTHKPIRGVQKVCRPTQLTKRYANHILSLFDIFSCNWNALGPEFLQSSLSILEELLFLVFQPAICRADNVLIIRNFVSFHQFFQFRKKHKSLKARTMYLITRQLKHWQIHNAGFELLHHPQYSPFVFVLHGKWQAGRPRTKFFYNGIRALDKCWIRCILVAGEYVKKSQNTICVSHS